MPQNPIPQAVEVLENNEEITPETEIDLTGMVRTLLDHNAKLNAKLDQSIKLQEKILKRLDNFSQFQPTNTRNDESHTQMPSLESFQQIDSVQDIVTFEENLKKDTFVKNMFLMLSSICGPNSGLNGKDLCYKYVDAMFTRKFFTLVSMTGNSRGGQEKENYSRFTLTFKFFLKLINRCSPDFSEFDLKNFFQNVIDNSKRRYEVVSSNKLKRTSTSKHQTQAPKRRKSNIETEAEKNDIEHIENSPSTGPIKAIEAEYNFKENETAIEIISVEPVEKAKTRNSRKNLQRKTKNLGMRKLQKFQAII